MKMNLKRILAAASAMLALGASSVHASSTEEAEYGLIVVTGTGSVRHRPKSVRPPPKEGNEGVNSLNKAIQMASEWNTYFSTDQYDKDKKLPEAKELGKYAKCIIANDVIWNEFYWPSSVGAKEIADKFKYNFFHNNFIDDNFCHRPARRNASFKIEGNNNE